LNKKIYQTLLFIGFIHCAYAGEGMSRPGNNAYEKIGEEKKDNSDDFIIYSPSPTLSPDKPAVFILNNNINNAYVNDDSFSNYSFDDVETFELISPVHKKCKQTHFFLEDQEEVKTTHTTLSSSSSMHSSSSSSSDTSPKLLSEVNGNLPLHLAAAVGSIFDKNIDFATLRIVVTDADFTAIALDGAKFNGLTLGSVKFSGNLKNLDFSGAIFANPTFTSATFEGVKFEEAKLPNVDFSGLDLKNLNFKRATLSGAKLSAIDLTGADLTGADLTGAIFKGFAALKRKYVCTKLARANLSNAKLNGANFSFADLTTDEKLAAYQYTASDAKRSNIQVVDDLISQGIDFTGANFSGADLSGADFRGCDLKNANFTNAKLSGANFTKTKFNKTANNLTKEQLKTVEGLSIFGSLF